MPVPLRFCFDDWHGILFQLSHPDPHASSRHVNERQEFASMRIVHMQAIVATMGRDDIPAPAQLRFRSVRSNGVRNSCCSRISSSRKTSLQPGGGILDWPKIYSELIRRSSDVVLPEPCAKFLRYGGEPNCGEPPICQGW